MRLIKTMVCLLLLLGAVGISSACSSCSIEDIEQSPFGRGNDGMSPIPPWMSDEGEGAELDEILFKENPAKPNFGGVDFGKVADLVAANNKKKAAAKATALAAAAKATADDDYDEAGIALANAYITNNEAKDAYDEAKDAYDKINAIYDSVVNDNGDSTNAEIARARAYVAKTKADDKRMHTDNALNRAKDVFAAATIAKTKADDNFAAATKAAQR